MYQYQDQKEMRRALNGKMIVMLVGIMLVMTALTSSLSYGMRCWSMAGMADKGNEEVLEALKQIDITSGTLRMQRSILYSGSDRNHGGNLLFPVKQSAG